MFAAAHGGIAYSNAARDYMIRHGMRPERIRVAHNSLDTESLLAIESQVLQDADFARRVKAERNSQDKPVVLFVGKLTRTKNVDLLLRAFEKVSRDHPTATLWLVGDGPERSILQSGPAGAANPRVQFFGEVSEPRAINSIYMAADIFALPGTGGLAINQAMTFGKPIVVSTADGTEEDLVTDGQNGLYFQPGDADDLAEKILRLLNDSELRARMGAASRQRILTTINMKNMVNSFCDAIFNRRSANP
jgi:glycosyltransferase involved in cell wall biosynthesis